MQPDKNKEPNTSKAPTSETTSTRTPVSGASSNLGSPIESSTVPRVPNPSLNTSPSGNTLPGSSIINEATAEATTSRNINDPSIITSSSRNANYSRQPFQRPRRNYSPTSISGISTRSGVSEMMSSSGHYRRNESRSPTPSMYTLDREVNRYVQSRDSDAYAYYPGAERLDYDYLEERSDAHSTNLIESAAHLIKGSLGAGVLTMHEAYMNGGLWTSLGVSILIGILISYAMFMLIKSAQKMYIRLRISKLSYPDLAEAAAATSSWQNMRKCSKAFRYTVDFCLFIIMSGTCCIYQMMIARTLKQAVEAVNPPTAERINIRLYILMSSPGLLLMCLIRSLKFLAPFAMIADIFVALCVVTSLYYSLKTIDVSLDARPAWKDFHGFVRFCGICMYCTSGICVALPIENNMRKPRYFPLAMQYAMTIVIVLTCMTGFFGYWGWGETCKSPITVHMPQSIFTTILQFLLVMMLGTTFAVQFWVPFRIIWHYIVRKCRRRKTAAWERFYRLLLALIVTGVTVAFPELIPVMIFLGQFFMGFIGIVFPAFIEFLVNYEYDQVHNIRWRLYKNVSMMILGLFLSATAFYSVTN